MSVIEFTFVLSVSHVACRIFLTRSKALLVSFTRPRNKRFVLSSLEALKHVGKYIDKIPAWPFSKTGTGAFNPTAT